VQLKDILKEKCRGKFTKGVLFLHDNAPHLQPRRNWPTWASNVLFTPLSSGSGTVRLPPVLSTEKQLEGRHFSPDAEAIAAAETWLDAQSSEFFLSGSQKSEQRAEKCIELPGEYVE